MTSLAFDVHGLPRPQGSKRAIVHRHTGRAVLIEDSHAKVQMWREDVKQAALAARRDEGLDGEIPFTGPVEVDVDFRFPRPKSHYRTGRNAALLRDGAPHRPAGKPDLDKLLRSTLDALTSAGVWPDDKMVVFIRAGKYYAGDGLLPGASLFIRDTAAPRTSSGEQLDLNTVDVAVRGDLL